MFCVGYRMVTYSYERGVNDTRGTVKLIDRKIDKAMARNTKDKQTNNSTHDTT